jgi:hypothetical protein
MVDQTYKHNFATYQDMLDGDVIVCEDEASENGSEKSELVEEDYVDTDDTTEGAVNPKEVSGSETGDDTVSEISEDNSNEVNTIVLIEAVFNHSKKVSKENKELKEEITEMKRQLTFFDNVLQFFVCAVLFHFALVQTMLKNSGCRV